VFRSITSLHHFTTPKTKSQPITKKDKKNQLSAPAYHTLTLWLECSQHYDDRVVSWWSFDICSKLVAIQSYHRTLETPVHQLLHLFIKQHLQTHTHISSGSKIINKLKIALHH